MSLERVSFQNYFKKVLSDNGFVSNPAMFDKSALPSNTVKVKKAIYTFRRDGSKNSV